MKWLAFRYKYGVRIQIVLGLSMAILGTSWHFWFPAVVLLASAFMDYKNGQPL